MSCEKIQSSEEIENMRNCGWKKNITMSGKRGNSQTNIEENFMLFKFSVFLIERIMALKNKVKEYIEQ